jgi:hypothetical protein
MSFWLRGLTLQSFSFHFNDGKVCHFLILKERKILFDIRVTPVFESGWIGDKSMF